ncbi:MAG: hypothetical protein CL525_14350 [Aequorivita sp.]|nr:hypothetical protein [Aequorivita sp.]|tara:strand:- start:1270 stop:2007 length:738 start_codon:yes stop_codon:yes gene_type:complete
MNEICIKLKAGEQVNPKFVPISRSATTGAAVATVTSSSQEPVFLRFLYLSMGAGVVNDVKVGNQSLNCSDSDISFALFQNDTQRKPLVGLAVDGNIQMSIDATTDADSALTGAFSCEAIETAPSISEQGNAINKFFGLGSVSLATTASGTLTAQALRNCRLKDLVLACHTASESSKIDVTDITIKGRSIFSGQSGDVVSLDALQTDTQAFTVSIDTPIQTNETVTVSLKNNHSGTLVVSGGLYCE